MTALLPRRLAPLLLSAVLFTACDTGEPDDGGFTPVGDEVIEGVNLTALFRAPTAEEQAAVRALWATRDQTLGARYAFDLVGTHPGAGEREEFRVYRARDVQTGATLFHGVVRLPPRPLGDTRQRPLLLVLPDGDDGASARLLTDGTLPILSSERDDLVYALVAYRGEPLEVAGTTYPSTATPSPYDRDVDDALAFLGHVRGLGPRAFVDPNEVGVLGLGRGGGTVLLTEARTHPYDIVIDLAGPTDLFLDRFRARTRALLRGQSGGAFPGIEALAEAIVYPLRDGAITLAQARTELLLRSPRYFTAPPPFIAVAHGEFDAVVPVEHSRVLDLRDPGPVGGSPAVYLEVPDADHASLLDREEVTTLVTAQLREHLSL